MTQPADEQPQFEWPAYRLSAAVFAQHAGRILVLKRAGGEATGAWYLPGGAVDKGETLEEGALRELHEEAGVTPSGPLTLIGLAPMRVYGVDSIQATYACDCPSAEVTLSHEHSDYRWIDPWEYRDRYFGQTLIEKVTERDERIGALMRSVRQVLDRYLDWREHQALDGALWPERLTADVFVLREGWMLVLKRKGGVGDGFWYVPGGIVEPDEDPSAAAARETAEETGLGVGRPDLLRVWRYAAPDGGRPWHVTYVVDSPAGDVTLSAEHSDWLWIEPQEYIERYVSEAHEAAVPQYAEFFREVRRNIELLAPRLSRQAPPTQR